MSRIAPVSSALVLLALASSARPAAAYEQYVGTRPLGMGGASRAWALGDAGPLLNPSGMSLFKNYTVEAAYQYGRTLSENFFHGSIVDSTSQYNIAGGVYYTYHLASPSAGIDGRGHEGGLALSVPFGEMMAFGGTVKYFRLTGDDTGLANQTGGVTFDLGATVRPTPMLSLALVGTNLSNLHNGVAAQGLAYGGALVATPNFLLLADARTTFTADNHTGRKGTSVMGGIDYTIAERVALRAGGGYDAASGNGYATAGISGISEIAAFDAGFRQDLVLHKDSAGVESARQTIIGVSVRLFVPAPPQQPPQ